MVEKWLLQVEETMIASVRKVISESFNAYANTSRGNWVLEWPGQIVICVSSIFWTAEVTDAMKHHDGVQVRLNCDCNAYALSAICCHHYTYHVCCIYISSACTGRTVSQIFTFSILMPD